MSNKLIIGSYLVCWCGIDYYINRIVSHPAPSPPLPMGWEPGQDGQQWPDDSVRCPSGRAGPTCWGNRPIIHFHWLDGGRKWKEKCIWLDTGVSDWIHLGITGCDRWIPTLNANYHLRRINHPDCINVHLYRCQPYWPADRLTML